MYKKDMIERGNLLIAVFGLNLRRATFTICSYFVAVGLFNSCWRSVTWRWCFLKKHPQSFHSGSSARIMSIIISGPAVKNHIWPKMAGESSAIYRTTYHSLSLVDKRVLPCHSPSLTSSKSSSQDSVIGTKNLATERIGSMSAELRVNPLQRPGETENTNENEDDEERNPSHEHRDTSSSSHAWITNGIASKSGTGLR